MRIAVYPGTFDPVTNGHLDILYRSSTLFDRVIVAIATENYKNTLFTIEERFELLRKVIGDLPNVEVEVFSGLLVDYVKAKGACAIIRGLRAVSDFDYEFQVALMNKKLYKGAETVFLTTDTKYSFLSSSIIKKVASLGGCVKGLVPEEVEEALKKKYNLKEKNIKATT